MSLDEMRLLAQEFRAALEAESAGDDSGPCRLPNRESVATLCRRYLEVLFPLYFHSSERAAKGRAHTLN